MSDGEDPEVSMLRAEVEALKAERDSAVAVLLDFLEERGESWLAKVVKLEPQLRSVLMSITGAMEGYCGGCGAEDGYESHKRTCPAAMLRNAMEPGWANAESVIAHDEALDEKRRREAPVGVADGLLVTREQWERMDYHQRSAVMTSGTARVRMHETGGTSVQSSRLTYIVDGLPSYRLRSGAIITRENLRVAYGNIETAHEEALRIEADLRDRAPYVSAAGLLELMRFYATIPDRVLPPATPSASARTGG